MKLLLDTHIWIWSQLEPDRLVRRVAHALRNRDHELWLSPISVWEFLLLVEKGRIVLKGDAGVWAREAMEKASLEEAPLTRDIALESRKVDLTHGDPADRFLVATARVLDLVLVTSDERLLASKSCGILANR